MRSSTRCIRESAHGRRSATATLLAVVLASACGDATAPTSATQLVLTTAPPAAAQDGLVFTRQPIVQLRDAAGGDIATVGIAVTATLVFGGGVLDGTITVRTDAGGRAAFDLAIVGASGPHALRFSTTALAPATSGTIDLGAAPASGLSLVTSATAVAMSGDAFAQQPVFQLRDADGVDVLRRGVSVTASIASGYGTLDGALTALTDAGGLVAFADLGLTGAGAHTLRFVAAGIITGTSAIITLPTPLQSSAPTPALGGAAGSSRWFVVSVAPGTPSLAVVTGGGTGNADLFVRHGALPSAAAYDCASTGAATVERCDIARPAAGDWFVRLQGTGAYAGVSVAVPTAAGCSIITAGDSDGDRLPDCAETNTGVVTSLLDTGTDPGDPDSDADGLSDGDEVLGTVRGLDLPAMGVSPLRRDLLLEYDWVDDALECAAHSHRPTVAVATMLAAAFAGAPIRNPDGSTGITLISDYGQGGPFTGGNRLADPDGVLAGGIGGPEFLAHQSANFAAERAGYFHYVLMPHRYETNSSSSGQAEQPGHNLIVALYCANSDGNVANTIMHELGHNLGLRHGGFDDINGKPNYNSVMNYRYQFAGINNDCTLWGSGILSYSVGQRPMLDENGLDEAQGVCGAPPGPGWDWNGDGDADDTGVVRDISGDGLFMQLRDHRDWANLAIGGPVAAVGGPLLVGPRPVSSCPHPELPWVGRR